MGWTSSDDMRQQVTLEFDTSEEAVGYAEKHGISYQVFEPHNPRPRAKAYSSDTNFSGLRPQAALVALKPVMARQPEGRVRATQLFDSGSVAVVLGFRN